MEAQSQTSVVPRWAALLLGGVALGLVPWTLYLTYALPAHHVTNHWRVAWAGFDLGLTAALVATAIGVVRAAPWLEGAAAVATTLLVTDAWFDNLLANGSREQVEAALEAGVGEIPLALICIWIVCNAEHAIAAVLDVRGRRA
jgi:hypothetical protein